MALTASSACFYFKSQALDGELIVGQAVFPHLLPGQVAQGLGQKPAAGQDDRQGCAHDIQVAGPVAVAPFIARGPRHLKIAHTHGGDPQRQQAPHQLDRQAREAGERLVIYRRGRPEPGLGHHHAGGQAVEDETDAAGQQPGAAL